MTKKEQLLQASAEYMKAKAKFEKISGVKYKPGDADKVIAAAKAGQKWVEL